MHTLFPFLNPFYAIAIYIIAFFTAYFLKSNYKISYTKSRYETIDGLRGFLAIGVFVHHTSVWYKYIGDGSWKLPSSNFYSQLGQSSVSLFFMITSFLFISKLLNSGGKAFNWKYFFVSRVFRLVPMYYFSLAIMIFIIMCMSQWQIKTAHPIDFTISIAHWCMFTIYKTALINDAVYTSTLNAGVVWSLQYEWLFYFSLPLIALFILKRKPGVLFLIIGAAFIISFYEYRKINVYYVCSFVGGAVAPILLRYTNLDKKINPLYASVIIISCLFMLLQFSDISNVYAMILNTVIFTLIAMGCTVFGVLKNSILKFLGEICYSTYLLHGIVLYLVFNLGFGLESLKKYSTLEYYSIVFSLTPALIIISYFGFKYIEKPFIDRAKTLLKEKNS